MSASRAGEPPVVIGGEAFGALAELVQGLGWRRALLVMDANTEEAAGARVADTLAGAGLAVGAARFAQRDGLAADERAVAFARRRLSEERSDGIVAVGSGVLTDVARFAAHREGRDFVSVPTAASMDGYASSVAAMEFGGVKVTFPAVAPRGVFADPAVVRGAPAWMTRAGLGDLLGKASARTDWLAAHLLYGEPFSAAADARISVPLAYAAEHADAVLQHEPAAIEALLRGLVESGLAMTMFGNSRPASGCEHHASHFWDLLAGQGRRAHASHGLQVGCATTVAVGLQRFAFGGGIATLREPVAHEPGADARAWLGDPLPQAIEGAVAGKQRFLETHRATWPGPEGWPDVCAHMAEALTGFPAVERALARAGFAGAGAASELGIEPDMLQAAFRHGNWIRARYTTVDLLQGQGRLEDALEVVLGS